MDGWREADDGSSKGELLAEMNSAGYRERLIEVEGLKESSSLRSREGILHEKEERSCPPWRVVEVTVDLEKINLGSDQKINFLHRN